MYIPWIEFDLHPFQICGVKDCLRDAKHNYTVKGSKYSMGACDEPGHLTQVTEALESCFTPKALTKKGMDVDQLFVQPEGKDKRIKLTEWTKLQEAPAPSLESAPRPSPSTNVPVPVTQNHVAVFGWAWIERPGWWMTVMGAPMHLSKMTSEELLDAVLAIRKANFARITARISWIRDIEPRGRVRHVYPEEALAVGFKMAGFKLEEMREVLESRALA